MPDQSPETVLVDCAGDTVPVAVRFRERTRLSISVHPDGSVTALAPTIRTLDDVVAHLHRRRSWIARQLRQFQGYQPLPVDKRYVSGETHLYLGRQYRLRVHQGKDASVRLVGRFFEVYVPNPKQPQTIAALMQEWYQSHAEAIFRERLRRCMQLAPSLRLLKDIKLRVRPMERRWGSCSKAGMITLNTNLIKTPLHCVEYVIMHELCHLRIHNHSPGFFRMLGRCMPDWRRRKERLDSVVLH
ncbi:MAG: SprT family zinc-dependent metalloprotease [Phycisphaerales bacterium]